MIDTQSNANFDLKITSTGDFRVSKKSEITTMEVQIEYLIKGTDVVVEEIAPKIYNIEMTKHEAFYENITMLDVTKGAMYLEDSNFDVLIAAKADFIIENYL